MKYTVKSPIISGGKRYPIGSAIELDDEIGKRLLARGRVELPPAPKAPKAPEKV